MKSHSKNSRRIRSTRQRPVFDAIETLEQRMLLSVATITNDAGSKPVDGALTVTVDSYGAFGDNMAQSGALYQPFTGANYEPSVYASGLYFQPAGGFLTEQNTLFDSPPNGPGDFPVTALPSGTYTSTSVNSVTSQFSVAGFDITLTQTVEPIPDGDGTTQLVQAYTIYNDSNTTYDNTPFTVVRYMQSHMPWGGTNTGQDWGALSGDERIAIAFDDLNADSPFERIDVAGINGSGASSSLVPDWEDPVTTGGASIVPNGAATSKDADFYQTIISNQGIPTADNGVVAGDTTGDLLDDSAPATYERNNAILAVSDSLTIPIHQSVTYVTTTGWGDTGTEAPSVYRQPGTWNISAVNTVVPQGQDAMMQIYRTNGSLGHATVEMADDTFDQPFGPSLEADPDAIIEEISYSTNPPNPIVLLDGQASTGVGDAVADPLIPVFQNTKIEGAQDFVVEIDNPMQNSVLATPAPGYTITNFTVPASNQPAPFSFATTNPGTTQAVTTSWPEGQDAVIAVMRPANDDATPTNSGPYGTFNVQYTITGSGDNAATPGVDFVDNTPGSTLTNGVYTGSLTFPAATTAAEAAQPQYEYINLQTLTDNLYEGNETFTIALQSSNPLLITTPSTFTGTIIDQQTSGPVHLQFASDSVAVSATSIVSKTIGVLRSNGSTGGQVTIDYTVAGGSAAGDAVAGTDFTVPGGVLSNGEYTGTLTFDVGAANPDSPLVIDLPANAAASADKSLTITLSLPEGQSIPGLIGSPNVETLTLTNNHMPGEVYFLGGATQSIAEGPDPTTGAPYKMLTLQVTRDPSDGSAGAVSIHYSTADGTALAGTDYQSASGTLTWADGQTGTMDIQVKVYYDTTDPYPRTNKNFTVNLSDPTGGVALSSPSTVTVTITNNQQPGVNFSNTSYTAYEKDPSTGEPGTANIVVERDLGDSAVAPWSFTYTVIAGTAVPGVDYQAPSSTTTTVTITDPTQATYTIAIPILADDNNTSDTSFTVRLTGATIGSDTSALGSSTAATVNITNADADVALGAASYTANPGSGMVPIVINRTGRSDAALVVSYTTVDGTAIAGTDYTATTGSITIPAGQNSVTLDVPILTPAGSTLPTRSFTFKITGAVLADPTTYGNSITVNFSSTPATISIAGEVSATNVQLQSGKGNKVNRIVVTFSDPLNAAGVPNLNNYILTTIGSRGAFNKQIALTNAQPDASTQSVTLYTKTNLSKNKLYQLSIRSNGSIVSMSNQPFVTGAPGGLGGTQIATFSRGNKVKYADPDGDIVTLQIKHGGSIDFINGVNGADPSLILSGSTKSQLTGSVKQVGDGRTIIASIVNPDGVQDLLDLNPDFTIESGA